jgi:hypothetical protein
LPAIVVSDELEVTIPRFSVIGTYDEIDSKFVKHVSILAEEDRALFGVERRVLHMGPPLVVGALSRQNAGHEPVCPCHVAAWIGLTVDERDGIIDWLAEIDKESRPTGLFGEWKTYTVSPPECWREDERGVRLYRRFSCGGFVLATYRDGAGITLIEVPPPVPWPDSSLDQIVQAYGPEVRERETLRRNLGMSGNGPWPVLLAGYVIHALDRPDHEIRTTPFAVTDPDLARFDRPAKSLPTRQD